MSLNESVVVIEYFCHNCKQEVDVITDRKCGQCNSSCIEELLSLDTESDKTDGQTEPTGEQMTNDCTICLNAMHPKKERVVGLRCGHQYHKTCVKEWLLQKNTCPLCRTVIELSSVITPVRKPSQISIPSVAIRRALPQPSEGIRERIRLLTLQMSISRQHNVP